MAIEPSCKHIRKALLSYAEEHFGWGDLSEYMNYHSTQQGKMYQVPGLGDVKIVDYHNYDVHKNYDGWHEDIWIVFEIQGKLYRACGTHSSYAMSTWEDEMTVVEPKTKTVTYYEDV